MLFGYSDGHRNLSSQKVLTTQRGLFLVGSMAATPIVPFRGISSVIPQMPPLPREAALDWLVAQPEVRTYLLWRLRNRVKEDPATGLWSPLPAPEPKPPRPPAPPKAPKIRKPGGRPAEYPADRILNAIAGAKDQGLNQVWHLALERDLDIPKTTLQSALVRLAAKGLVTIKKNSGAPRQYTVPEVEV
jgi:hypothetical protein